MTNRAWRDNSHQVRLGFSLESPEDSEEDLILSGDLKEEDEGEMGGDGLFARFVSFINAVLWTEILV